MWVLYSIYNIRCLVHPLRLEIPFLLIKIMIRRKQIMAVIFLLNLNKYIQKLEQSLKVIF